MPRTEEFDREQILGKAMQVFWDQGFEGTSMQDLVEATGLNRSSIYNSFGSKAALYQDSLKLYQEKTGIVFQRALVKASNPLDAIRGIFEAFLPEILRDHEARGCFVMNCKSEMSSQDENLKNWLLGVQEYMISIFQDLVEDGQEQGLINKDQDSQSYAYYIFNAFQGFRMTGILVKEKAVLQQIIDNNIKILK